MQYKTDYLDIVDNIKIPKVIDDEFVKKINEHYENMQFSDIRSYGICGKDVSEVDMSNLSYEKFLQLSFDSNTIFSKEQNEKFHPDKILKECENYYRCMQYLHKAGITGIGINVLIVDTPFDHTSEQFKDIKYNDSFEEDKSMSHMHGMSVTSIFKHIAPEANISFDASQADCDDFEKFYQYRYNLLKNICKDENVPDIISMSSSIGCINILKGKNEKEISNELVEELKNKGCEFVDSIRFGKTFDQCNCYNENYNKIDSFSITDEEYEALKIKIKEDLNNVGKFKDFYSEKELNERIEILKNSLKSKEEYENSLRKVNLSHKKGEINIVSGGITYTQNDCNGGKMYSAYASRSWAIPQASAMYAIAKQMDKNITYDEFCEVCKNTAIESPSNLKVINPEGIVRQINEQNRVKSQIDSRYVNIYNNSSKLIDNLDRVKEEKNRKNIQR